MVLTSEKTDATGLEERGSNAAKDHVRPRGAPPDPQNQELASSTSDSVTVAKPCITITPEGGPGLSQVQGWR